MKILLCLLAVVIVLGGYYFYKLSTVAPVEIVPDTTLATSTPVAETPVTQAAPAQIAQFSNQENNFGFKFRIKPYGYSTFENTAQQNLDQDMLFGVTLVRSDDYNESVKAAAEGNAHDGPPAISVLVFDGRGVNDIGVWMAENILVTNCEQGTVLATVLAGKDASSCLWDGLYQGVTIGLLDNNKIYILTGTREGAETPDGFSYEKDFNGVVESFRISK